MKKKSLTIFAFFFVVLLQPLDVLPDGLQVALRFARLIWGFKERENKGEIFPSLKALLFLKDIFLFAKTVKLAKILILPASKTVKK